MLKRILAVIFSITAVFTALTFAFAATESDVTFNGASGFIFNPESGDLFQDFKNMMPGDVKEQRIVIQNTSENKPVTIYLRAEVSKEYKDFFDYMTISVYKSRTASTRGTLITENKASEEGVLLNDTSLGEYRKGTIGYLTVVLKIDKSMGNDYMFKEGIIKWIFTAEEDETTKPTTQLAPTTEPTTKPTTQPTTKPTTAPSEPTTRKAPVPTVKPSETTKPTTTRTPASVIADIPNTGSSNTLPISIVCLGALSFVSIILIKSKKEKN